MSLWQRRTGIQLAHPYEVRRLTGGGRIKAYNKPWIVQPKFNGERGRVIIDRYRVTLVSSEENEITCLPHINKAYEVMNLPPIELDGELYVHGMPRQQIHSIVSRKTNQHPDFQQVQHHLFDVIDEQTNQIERLNQLYALQDYSRRTFLSAWDEQPIRFTESNKVEDIELVEALLVHYHSWNYEGIIIRNPAPAYVRRRTVDMMKWKPRKKDSYLIVGYAEEVDKHHTPKGTLGAIECEKNGERFWVGSGRLLTRPMREQLFITPDDMIGKYATIKYPELTLRGVPDHPVILEITETQQDFDDE